MKEVPRKKKVMKDIFPLYKIRLGLQFIQETWEQKKKTLAFSWKVQW